MHFNPLNTKINVVSAQQEVIPAGNAVDIHTKDFLVDPLTPELNPSAQRCLRIFTGDFAS
jgi:hypothetical protein